MLVTLKEILKIAEEKKIAVGAELFQDADWELMGLLPQANTGVEGVWNGRMLEVTLI